MKHLTTNNLNNDLINIAYKQLIYYDKLFLYNDNNNLILIPTGLGNLKPIGFINKNDLYNKEYFNLRKNIFFDKYNKYLPFQKAKLFGEKAKNICHNEKLKQIDKLFDYGLNFYDGYNAAYIDFTEEPLKWLNLNLTKKQFEKFEKTKIYDSNYEFAFSYIQFYIDLNNYKKNKNKE